RSFRHAHRAVLDLSRLVTELRNTPGTQPLCKKLSEAALGYYRSFLAQRGDDPRLKAELAYVQFECARLTREIGNRGDALQAYRGALAIYEELAKAQPGNETMQANLANTWYHLGIAHSADGRRKESRAAYLEAQGLYERVLKARPEHPRALAGLADIA